MHGYGSKIALLLTTLAATAPVLGQTIWYVNANATGTQSGLTWANAFVDLQDALETVSEGDQIWVAKSAPATPSYKPSVTYPDPNDLDPRHKTFFVSRGVRVYGGFLGVSTAFPTGEDDLNQRNPEVNLTILDGNIDDPNTALDNAYHVVRFQGTEVENPDHVTKLSGFVVRNGRADGDSGVPATEFDSKGAGILVLWESGESTGVMLNRLVIEDNYASEGGGGARIAGKTTTYLTNCLFRNNIVEEGNGAGLLEDESQGTSFVAQNCVFFQNECIDGIGGGAAGSGEFLVNCTFWGNLSASAGGPVGAYYSNAGPNPSTTMVDSIVWNNSYEGGLQLQGVGAYYCDVQDESWTGGSANNISDDPRFRNAAAGDLTIIQSSPCLDMGVENDPNAPTHGVRPDTTDVNDNGDSDETTPWDEKKASRVVRVFPPEVGDAGDVDMGGFEQCPGDVNGDGTVGLSDLTMLLSAFGTTSCTGSECWSDLEPRGGDGDVDLSDLARLLSCFGNNCLIESPGLLTTGSVAITVEGYDTGSYSGDGFHGESNDFVFDVFVEIGTTADDWTSSGVTATATNGAEFVLVPGAGNPPAPGSTTPAKYATFFSVPYAVNANNRFDFPFPSGGIVAKYSGAGGAVYSGSSVDAAWYDTNGASADGPAAVFRLVIDVKGVTGANTAGGFGSVYFTTGSPGAGDIKVADMTFKVMHKYLDAGSTVTTGSFYVND